MNTDEKILETIIEILHEFKGSLSTTSDRLASIEEKITKLEERVGFIETKLFGTELSIETVRLNHKVPAPIVKPDRLKI